MGQNNTSEFNHTINTRNSVSDISSSGNSSVCVSQSTSLRGTSADNFANVKMSSTNNSLCLEMGNSHVEHFASKSIYHGRLAENIKDGRHVIFAGNDKLVPCDFLLNNLKTQSDDPQLIQFFRNACEN